MEGINLIYGSYVCQSDPELKVEIRKSSEPGCINVFFSNGRKIIIESIKSNEKRNILDAGYILWTNTGEEFDFREDGLLFIEPHKGTEQYFIKMSD